MGNAGPAIEIRIARKQRIGFCICIPTCVVAIVGLGWVVANGLNSAFGLIGIPLCALLIVQSFAWLKWRLFIDRNGITTKLYRWSNCWTWEDFASGRIRK